MRKKKKQLNQSKKPLRLHNKEFQMSTSTKVNDNFTRVPSTPFEYKKHNSDQGPIEKLSSEAGQMIGAYASDVAHTAQSGMKKSRDYVIANPAKGVAIAVATGILAGSLLTMVLRRK
jgi:ElaB/YqjD/DUF883 family membrane-anchored ribosome-binding protein